MPSLRHASLRLHLPAIAICTLLLVACGGGGSPAPTPAPAPAPAPVVSITMAASVLETTAGSGQVSLSAFAVDTNGSNYDVSWKLAEGSPGSISGSGNYAHYMPPKFGITQTTTATIVATSGTTSNSLSLKVHPNPGQTPDPLPNPEPPPFVGPAPGQPGLSLIAGHLGSQAHADGSGARARFQSIGNVLVDRNGNIYVSESFKGPDGLADRDAMNVRTVSASGQVSTVLMLPTKGKMELGQTRRMSLDSAGNVQVYINDQGGWQRLAADGSLSTGVEPLIRSFFGAGQGYTFMPSENPSYDYSAIHKVDGNGRTTPFAGTTEQGFRDGDAGSARFYRLTSATVDHEGSLYVIDGNSIRKVSRDGVTTTLAGIATESTYTLIDGKGSAARFNSPTSIALAGQHLLVLDGCLANCGGHGRALRTVSLDGVVTTLGPMPDAAYLFSDNAANAYLQRGTDILKFGTDSRFQVFAGYGDDSSIDRDGSGAAARLRQAKLMALDPAGNMVVAEQMPFGFHLGPYGQAGIILRRVTPAGGVSTLIRSDGSGAAAWPALPAGAVTGMAFDQAGNLYLSEKSAGGDPRFTSPDGGAVYRIAPDGKASVFAGLHGSPDANAVQRDGTGADARFTAPSLLGFDRLGHLYVADAGNTLRRITPDAVVTTVAALPPEVGALDDAAGNRYVADTAANTISRRTPAGVLTVIAGKAGHGATIPGALPASLDAPRALIRLGPSTLGFISGNAVVRLELAK